MPVYFLENYGLKVTSEDSIFIAPSADLIGKVVLRAFTSVWFGAVLRGDNEPIIIEEGSNIQDLTVIHTDIGMPVTIGKDCTIGHRVLLHGCSIGDNCLIGMGAIIMSGAEIGKNSVIGAGTLITEGKKTPPQSLIFGNPAICRRSLKDEEIAAIRRSSLIYQENARRFKAGLKVATSTAM
ncbi:MAG: Acetyltransferase [Candidatus Tokpelaia sp. JSC085]|nr:MAG: Acetyltransferase [Candidatus Tokpelaia sp. JSC085]